MYCCNSMLVYNPLDANWMRDVLSDSGTSIIWYMSLA